MRRKIVGQGAGARTVILPIKWVRKLGLEPGDDVEIIEHENKLTLSSPHETSSLKEKEITMTSMNMRHIKEVIASLYRAGYEVITLNFPEAIDLIELQKIVDSFTGLDLLVEAPRRIRVQSFLLVSSTEIENLIRKLFQTVQTIGNMIAEDFAQANMESIAHIGQSMAGKLANHCIRSIQQTNYGGTAMELNINVVRELQRIALDMSYYAEYRFENKIHTSPTWGKIIQFYTETRTLFLSKKFTDVEEIYQKHRVFVTEMFSPELLSSTVQTEDRGLMSHHFLIFMHLRNLEGHLFSLALFN